MHTNDMLKPLGGLRLSGWIAEVAGCILGGGAENIGGWVRGSEGVAKGALRQSGQMVLGKDILVGGLGWCPCESLPPHPMGGFTWVCRTDCGSAVR
eukprot:1553995-Pyramimonas_sp.AAC.1